MGATLVNFWAIISKDAKKKGNFNIIGDFKTLKLIPDILQLQMKSKKNVLSVLTINFRTHTRYTLVAMKSKKKS